MSSAPASEAPHSYSRAGLLILTALTFIWGCNWPAMKSALSDVPVWTFRALSMWGGGLGLILVARISGHSLLIARRDIAPTMICAFFGNAAWYLLSAYGISLSGAGHAAIVAYTMPIWAVVLGRFVLQEPLSGRKLLGLALGLAGVAVLGQVALASLDQELAGVAWMLGAAFSWALGTVLLKRFPVSHPPLVAATWQVVLASIPLGIGAVLREGWPTFDYSTQAWLGLLYATFIAMTLGQWAWYALLRLLPASIASISILAIPVVGVLSSAYLLGEPLGWREAIALSLVLGGIGTVLQRPKRHGRA